MIVIPPDLSPFRRNARGLNTRPIQSTVAHMKTPLSPQDRARHSAQRMMARDAASQAIGARIDQIGPQTATMSMIVRPDMLNGHEICHGGYIFMLADSAFAFACNSTNIVTVAQSNQITFVSPAQAGERLSATASAVAGQGRSATYDVTVTGEDGRVVALFRGLSRQLGTPHFDENNPD